MSKGTQLIIEIKALLTTPEFIARNRKNANTFIRSRKLAFAYVIILLLRLVKRSLSIECELMNPDPNQIPPSKQAFSKARYKLKHQAFKEILQLSNRVFYRDEDDYGQYKGYRLIAADGSSLRLPESSDLEAHFGRFASNGTQGKSPLLVRISLFTDLATGMFIDAELTGWDTGERTHAKKLLPDVLNQLHQLGQDNPLFIYDRGYYSYEYLSQHIALGADFLFRLQRSVCTYLWKRVDAGETDFIATLKGKEEHVVRVVAFTLSSGEVEVLLTSLLDSNKITYNDIVGLYALRWQIEECYKRLKISAELENFTGKQVEAILQEFWAHLAMCNILSTHIKDEQLAWTPNVIPEYRLNFTLLFGVMRTRLEQVLLGTCDTEIFQQLFKRSISRAKFKPRPGRQFSREKVNKPKRHHVFRRAC